MLPMGNMNEAVAAMMRGVIPLPTEEELKTFADAYIAKLATRIANAVALVPVLEERLAESLAILQCIQAEHLSPDPSAAVGPQDENIRQALAAIRKIHQEARSNSQQLKDRLNEVNQQRQLLEHELRDLQQLDAKKKKFSQSAKFLNDLSGRAGTYAANNSR